MLVEVLRLIATGKARSLPEMARQLNVSEALAVQMVEQLTRQGYLAAPALCGGSCAGCAQSAACGLKPALRLWTLTPKGYAAL